MSSRQGATFGRRRGSLLALLPVVVLIVVSMALLAVEWGRIQVVRAELQGAADAAAMYAASGPIDESARDRARESAAENRVNGASIVLAGADVQLGRWNAEARTFAADASPDAVKVTVRATVPLMFGWLIGRSQQQLAATATAQGDWAGYALIGLDYVRVNSTGNVDAYDSRRGAYSPANSGFGASVASNGYIEVISDSHVNGDVWHRAGQPVTVSGNSSIGAPGRRRVLPAPLSFPPVALPASYANGGTHSQDKGALRLAAGNYLYSELILNSGAELVVTGQVTIYVTKKFQVNSVSTANGQRPSQLRIIGLGNAIVDINSNSSLAAQIYNPGGEVIVNSSSDLYGTAVGKSILVNSDSEIHYDMALGGTARRKGVLVQ